MDIGSPFQSRLDAIEDKQKSIDNLKLKLDEALKNGNINEYRELHSIIKEYEKDVKKLYKFFD